MATGNPFIDRAAELYGQIASGAAALPVEPEIDAIAEQQQRTWQKQTQDLIAARDRMIAAAQENNRQVQARLKREINEQREQDAAQLKAELEAIALQEHRRVGGSDKDFARLWPDMLAEYMQQRREAYRARTQAANF